MQDILLRMMNLLLGCLLSIVLNNCNQKVQVMGEIKKDVFGKLNENTEVFLFTLTNKNGAEAKITNYGAIVVGLKMPDRSGNLGEVVFGYDNLDDYVKNNPYFGAIVGRYGNRIGKGKFTLEGVEYSLPINDGENSLHGGGSSESENSAGRTTSRWVPLMSRTGST